MTDRQYLKIRLSILSNQLYELTNNHVIEIATYEAARLSNYDEQRSIEKQLNATSVKIGKINKDTKII